MSNAPIIIRTSDRVLFRRCRRKWNIQSGIRLNLQPRGSKDYFWIGTGGHFAMEDYYGYNRYGNPVEAFQAYTHACKKAHSPKKHMLPDNWEEQLELATGILDYYLQWISTRQELKTLWYRGEPQVEVRAQIELPIKGPQGQKILYDMTFDRVIIDEDGKLWILDYKFYKAFRTSHLETDTQISSYSWGGSTLYDRPIEGFIYQQFVKKVPRPPKILGNGRFSTDKTQGTTHTLYREALIKMYGDVARAPLQNRKFLNHLTEVESEERDSFIRRDRTVRTPNQQAAEGQRILQESAEMANPDIACYTNPTGDCSWDCDFTDICLMQDFGDDWEYVLSEITAPREEDRDPWRKFLP